MCSPVWQPLPECCRSRRGVKFLYDRSSSPPPERRGGGPSGDRLSEFEERVAQAPYWAEARPRIARRPVSPPILSGIVQFLDFCVVPAAGWVALQFYNVGILGQLLRPGYERYPFGAILGAVIFVLSMRTAGGYQPKMLSRIGWQLRCVALSWAIALALLATVAYLSKSAEHFSRGWAIGWVLFTACALVCVRLGLFALIRHWGRQGRLSRVVAVVGAGDDARQLVDKLRAVSPEEIVIGGIFDDRDRSRVPAEVAGCAVVGTTDQLIRLAQQQRVDEIIIALPLRAPRRIGELVARLRSLPVDLRLSLDAAAAGFPMQAIGDTAGVPVIEILDRPLKHWSGIAKTIEDAAISLALLLLLLPLMLTIAVLIRLDSDGPVLFVQQRFGFNNRPIRVFKFRTMRVADGDPSGARRTVPGDPRVTRVGRVLRAFSLDELPQLINVLRGEMSLVGPRAHAVAMQAEGRLYHDAVAEYFRRHRVRPGITGWAQVNGSRGEIDTLEKARERVAYDLHYIENWSLWLDLKILLRTFTVLLSRQNAY